MHCHIKRLTSAAAAATAGLVLALAAGRAAAQTPTSAGPVSILDTPVFRIPMMKQPPKIDGVLEEKEWEDSSALSAFWYDRYLAHFMFLAPMQTQLQVYAAYDKENLYIAYTSPVYPERSWLKASGRFPDVTHHPQYGLIWDDHVELEIRPYQDVVKGFRMGLFKWFFNPIGTYTDQHWSPAGGEGMKWQSKAKIGSEVTDRKWTLELAIPLESLRVGDYAGKDAEGREVMTLPPPDGTGYRVWFTRGIGGNGAFFNVFDCHCWNTTKTMMVLDSKAPSFQINELGPIMEDIIDVQLTCKNHNTRSETVRIGFFVENPEGNIYSSYQDEELKEGLLELVPGEVKKIRLRKKFPGIATDGNCLWFDVRSAGQPAKPLFLTRLIDFHSMDGGIYTERDGTATSFRTARVDVIAGMRPPRKDFDFWYTYSAYANRMSAVVDKGIHGASDEARSAVEAKIVVVRADEQENKIADQTVPFRGDFACFLFDMPKLNSGHYRVSLLLFDERKRIVGESNPDPFYKGQFDWVNNQVGLKDVVWEPFVPMQVRDGGFETLKHVFRLDASGLPAQIAIKPEPRELPLEKRGGGAKVSDEELIALGRGPQLREPFRLEVVAGGKRQPAQVVQPANLVRKWNSELEYKSQLQAGPLPVDLSVQYDCDGAMTVRMTYGSAEPVRVEGLELVGKLAGQADMVVSAAHGGGMPGPDELECTLPPGQGVVWDSAKLERPGLFYTHFMPWLFVGTGDRAFTWIADSDRFWTIDKEGSTMTLERDAAGEVTWRVKFVNHPATIAGPKTIEFMLLTHPSKPKPSDYRRIAYFLQGDEWASLWGSSFGTDEEIIADWRSASGAPASVPDGERATYAKTDPPWRRFYQLRGSMPAFPALNANALTGDLLGRMQVIPTERTVRRIVDGQEKDMTIRSGGGSATMGRAWQDLFAWHFGRQVTLARRHGWWWDETWPTRRSANLAAGEAYLRDPNEVQPKELPWQENFVTLQMRGMFKRLARVFKESGVPLRNYFWANNSATLFESLGYDTLLVEACSSDHNSFDLDHVVIYPNSLVRYNAHNYSGLVTRLVPRDALTTAVFSWPGDDKRLDRQLLGRSLLNDIGVQRVGPHGRFQHNEQCVRLLNALIDFGYFTDDGQTEMIPYWRGAEAVRYGPALGDREAFTLRRDVHAVTPAKVYVTAFRRPLEIDGRKGCKVLLVVMNENDQPIRDRLYVPGPARLFGQANSLRLRDVAGGYRLPEGASGELASAMAKWSTDEVVLKDLEDGSFVRRTAAEAAKGETYDRLFVLPHNYRVLYGQYLPEK